MKKFAPVFEDGLVLCEAPGHRAQLKIEPGGTVRVPSGELLAIDPQLEPKAKSVRVQVPPGEYRVFISSVHAERTTTPAFTWVVFSDEPVAKWKKAGEVPVDGGFACFRDSQCPLMDEELPDDPRLVAVPSGLGDGRYRCFLGTTALGAPARLLIDFEVAYRETWLTVDWALPVKSADFTHPLLTELGVELELMDRWKSKPLDKARELGLEWKFPSVNVQANTLEFELVGPDGALPFTRETVDDVRSQHTVQLLLLRTDAPRPEGTTLRLRIAETRTPLLP